MNIDWDALYIYTARLQAEIVEEIQYELTESFSLLQLHSELENYPPKIVLRFKRMGAEELYNDFANGDFEVLAKDNDEFADADRMLKLLNTKYKEKIFRVVRTNKEEVGWRTYVVYPSREML